MGMGMANQLSLNSIYACYELVILYSKSDNGIKKGEDFIKME